MRPRFGGVLIFAGTASQQHVDFGELALECQGTTCGLELSVERPVCATQKNECGQRSCSNCCGPISIETDRINLQQRLLSPIFGSIQVPLPHAAIAAASATGGGFGRGRSQRQTLGPGLLLQRLEHGAGRGGVGGAGGHLHPWFWRHDWLRALVAAARRMA